MGRYKMFYPGGTPPRAPIMGGSLQAAGAWVLSAWERGREDRMEGGVAPQESQALPSQRIQQTSGS